MIRRPDHGVHFRADKGVRNDQAPLLAVIGAEINGKDAVNLAFGQRQHGVPRRIIGAGYKMRVRVLFRFLRKRKVIRQRAGQLFARLVFVAVRKEILPVSHADDAVMGKPVVFFCGQELVHGTGLVEFVRHLLVEIPVSFKQAVHSYIQIALQIRPVFVDAEERLRIPDLDHGDNIGRTPIRVQRHQHVNLAFGQHVQQLWRFGRQFQHLRVDVVFFRPLDKEPFLDTVLVDAHRLSVERSIVVRPYSSVAGRNKYMVILRPHRFRGIQDLLRALLRIRHVAQEIDLPCHQFLQQFGPASFHIFIFPARIRCDTLLVFVAVAGTPPEFIRTVERRFIPAHPHHFRLRLLGICGERYHQVQRHHRPQHKPQHPFQTHYPHPPHFRFAYAPVII